MQWSGRYDTPFICARDENGNEASRQKTELPVCYTDLYLKICFILWRCEDDRGPQYPELLRVQEQAEKFFGHGRLSRPVVPPAFRSLTHLCQFQSLLIRHGLFVGPWNMYNRNCVLHCGACGTCSNEADIQVLFDTRHDITQGMTECSLAYAKPWLLGGHNDKERLRACLRKKGISFTGRCMTAWTNDIDCAKTHCRGRCWKKFLPWRTYRQEQDCVQCDEDRCGPAFLADAGANRRSTGLVADIVRPDSAVCPTGMFTAVGQQEWVANSTWVDLQQKWDEEISVLQRKCVVDGGESNEARSSMLYHLYMVATSDLSGRFFLPPEPPESGSDGFPVVDTRY